MLLEIILAAIPFVILFVLIIGFRIPAIKSVPISLLVLIVISLIVWKVSFLVVGASFVKGFFISIEIILIVFGAILLLSILDNTKQLSVIQGFLSSINSDARIQIILISWLFVSLLEGVAGFGTPQAIVAPLLVSIGFTPIVAIAATLISDSPSVSFGAAGVPITLGLGSLGFSHEILISVTKMTAIIHSLAAIVVPLSLIFLAVSQSKVKQKRKAFFEAVPFAFFSWLVFIAVYLPIAYFIGPELPSIIAGFSSLAICGFAAKRGFLQPKSEMCFAHHHKKIKSSKKQIFTALAPYFGIILLLLLTRTITPLKSFLTSISVGVKNILGVGADYSFLPFYTPAFIFIIISVAFALFIGHKKQVSKSFFQSLSRIKKPWIALFFTITFVQLLILSGVNSSGLSAMPMILAKTLVGIFGQIYIFFAPMVGSVGAFIAGSNTVSNLLFATLQSEAAKTIGASVVLLLSLQVIGGAVGNMFAIHNILAAEATVHIHNQEGNIIRKVLVIASIYASFVGLIGLAIFYFF